MPWEENLHPGPVGEYLEVVDVDPASGVAYKPVDLNDPKLLAQVGLAPSEANPQFHQQMVYAVAMATISQFEQALGRVALWSSHRVGNQELFVRRLRIYPHALRDRNAYYSPSKKALLFGYFPVNIKNRDNVPGTLVFSCLSHDIIAHETTHALLDGVHPRFNEPVNADVQAFHEAFADIVALFQHFSYPGVLHDQIGRTRGNLADENLLGQLAQQFGKATGRGEALRDALGGKNKDGKWEPREPDVRALEKLTEPHARGAILVAAVFGAFLTVYRARTADLYRIASEGTGVLRAGAIHPDLANRLASEASRTAQQTLQMCIRALDYCPPVGITFGDYLRAIVTADADFNPDDLTGHRLAFAESFRQWGIHPEGMRHTSVESLLWPSGEAVAEEYGVSMTYKDDTRALFRESQAPGDTDQLSRRLRKPMVDKLQPWSLDTDRCGTWAGVGENAQVLWSWLIKGKGRKRASAFGLVLDENAAPSIYRSKSMPDTIAVEVHSVRWATRRSVRGAPMTDLVVEITQRRRGYFERDKQIQVDADMSYPPTQDGDFKYRAGCTLIINPNTMEVRRVIRTPGTIADNVQLERMRRHLTGADREPSNAFQEARVALSAKEPFALLHRQDGE
ncbi:MAG: hypothetical protein HY895_06380 [Deltaproteobacteria bacterium]|nr:hypothetical protein [Deltaproteobacteria bacterium]